MENHLEYSPKARWIWTNDTGSQRNLWMRFRRAFPCPADARRATLLITADSRYELLLNGEWVGHGPVRSFPWAYGYDQYDVRSLLRGGENVLAVRVVHWGDHTFQYILGRGGMLCELVLEFADGRIDRIVSDGQWLVAPDAAVERATPRITLQQGFEEHYDARRAEDGWVRPGFTADAWSTPRVLGPVGVEPWVRLVPRTIPFLTRDEITPIQVLAGELARPPAGYRWTFDLRERLGKERIGLRAEPIGRRGTAFVTEIIAPRRCAATFTVAAEYSSVTASLGGRQVFGSPSNRDDGSQPYIDHAAVQLEQGRNLFVLAGVTDWPSMLFATEEHLVFNAARVAPSAPGNFPWAYVGPLDERDETVQRCLAATNPDDLPSAPRHAIADAENQEDVFLLTTTQRFMLPPSGFCDPAIDRPQPRERVAGAGPLLDDAPRLLHRDSGYAVIHPRQDGDPHLVVDFGRELIGFLVLELDAPEGVIIDVNLFEAIDDSGIFWTRRLRNTLRYTCRAGYQTFRSSVRRGFRYASLTFRAMPGPVKLHNLRCLLSTYPVEERGRFACSDAALTKIWEVAAYTVRLCMEDTYTDCPAYEQVAWVGDARNSALVNAVAFGAYELTDHWLRLVGRSLDRNLDRLKPPHLRERPHLTTDQVVSGWFSEIPMWTFLWIWSVWEHYTLTGDRESLWALYPDVRECLSRCLGFLTERDLLDIPDVWNLIDWAANDLTRDGEVTANNALLVESLRRAALMADELSSAAWETRQDPAALGAEAETYRAAAERVNAAINACCWSEERGAYVDTVRDGVAYERHRERLTARGARPDSREQFLARTRVSEPTNTLVLLCGCTPPDRASRILPLVEAACAGNYVGSAPERAPAWPAERIVPVGSPWFLFFTLETLVQQGQVEAALALVHEQWGRMLEKGATTFWETFPGFVSGHWSRSLCHGWSAAPAYFLSTLVLGVAPAAPGYARVRIIPRACGLRWAQGYVPTPLGQVRVRWTRTDEEWEIEVDLPPGMVAEVAVRERTDQPHYLAGVAGEVSQETDGSWRIAAPGGGYLRYRLPLAP